MKDPEELKIKESIGELKKLRSKQKNLTNQKRVDCIIHLKLSKFKTRQQLANHLSIHIRTQERWIVKYKAEGLEQLLSVRPQTRKSKIITAEIHEGLAQRVNSSTNPFLGYWEAQIWVGKTYGVQITYHWIRKYLIQHFKTKLKSPRKSHYKKDEQAIEAFLKTS